jgi:hypothetical protein
LHQLWINVHEQQAASLGSAGNLESRGPSDIDILFAAASVVLQFMRDPFSWFEQQFAKQQQQSQQQQGYQGYQRQQQQQQQRQQQYGGSRASSSSFSRGDPLGYYNTLGIKPGCSTQEVQAAFRGLALKHHPDRYSTDVDKQQATKKFQVGAMLGGWQTFCERHWGWQAAGRRSSRLHSKVGQ